MRVLNYFANLRTPKLVLWCYLAWYLTIVPFHFEPSPLIWFTALGISALIGIALIFATKVPGQAMDGWTKFRLFLFPFCVSSYSSLIKGKGFILLFPTEMRQLLSGVAACVAVVVFQRICVALVPRGLQMDPPPADTGRP
ncbi:hypothetical protein [Luteolibacter luteus]|uniref:Transmembrane protein n=1 Tax=Luteolibacter luteus TaxID=2728835 RepID=A0A858RDX0_9BACT|nr:hypothetical protein [Luteolibacter luteus]QJE94778.1 hypothetical protein HHL09_02945 [Luteolibacter luteus]